MKHKPSIFTVEQAADGQWFWHERINGRITGSGQGYNREHDARRALKRMLARIGGGFYRVEWKS